LSELEPLLDEVVITRMHSSRAMDVSDLYDIARGVFDQDRAHLAPSLADALDRAAGLAEAGGGPAGTTGVLVIGSVMLAAEARALLGRTEA
ncbi:MAG: bifunctional folylpolyglutamate synthase/dihydrofolate synthase, partial [Actinomycetota bacterium]